MTCSFSLASIFEFCWGILVVHSLGFQTLVSSSWNSWIWDGFLLIVVQNCVLSFRRGCIWMQGKWVICSFEFSCVFGTKMSMSCSPEKMKDEISWSSREAKDLKFIGVTLFSKPTEAFWCLFRMCKLPALSRISWGFSVFLGKYVELACLLLWNSVAIIWNLIC